jgi:hypothetical protein
MEQDCRIDSDANQPEGLNMTTPRDTTMLPPTIDWPPPPRTK